MRVLRPSLLLVGAFSLLLPGPPAVADEPPAASPAIEYRTSVEVNGLLADLAESARAAGRDASVLEYGKSEGGRSLSALRLGSAVPTVFVHGGLGRRDAAATVACLELARRLVADVQAWEGTSWLLVPAPNPDALDAFLAGREPTGGLVDRDRDGQRGEDGPSDVDGDGEVLRMRRLAVQGRWAPATDPPGADGKARGDERLVEERGVDARRAVSYDLLDEGLDDDADGDVNEDPPGLDLERQLAGTWDGQAPWAGDGPFPGYALEARALMELTFRETGLVGWYGFKGTGSRILRASREGKAADADDGLYGDLAGRLKGACGLDTRRASKALGRPGNPGSDLDWAAVHLGLVAFRVPVWWIDKEEGNGRKRDVADELDWLLWNDRVLGGEGFVGWRALAHPTLGAVEVGGWKRFTRHEPPTALLPEAVRRVAGAPLVHGPFHPKLAADVVVVARGEGVYEVALRVLNRGGLPTDTRLAEKQRRSTRVRVAFEPAAGAALLAGDPLQSCGRLDPGASSAPLRWLLRRSQTGPLGKVSLHHPKADAVEEEVTTP